MTQARRMTAWLLLALFAATISYIGFRGYLSPEFLIDFANVFVC